MSDEEDSYLNKQDMDQALQYINNSLAHVNEFSEMYIVGGAALAMYYNMRDLTEDIDAVYTNRDLVQRIADSNEQLNFKVGHDWLNDKVRVGIIEDKDRIPYYKGSNLMVYIASPVVLLKMKMKAARSKDSSDVEQLLRLLNIPNYALLRAEFLKTYPDAESMATIDAWMKIRYRNAMSGKPIAHF